VTGVQTCALPISIISDSIGLCLLAASFFLPEEPDPHRGDACSCGCDFHIHASYSRVNKHWGVGALCPPRPVLRKLDPREAYRRERYGFMPAPLVRPPALNSDRMLPVNSCGYSWHSMPKLEGALLRRLGGFGSSAAVRCEYQPAHTVARV